MLAQPATSSLTGRVTSEGEPVAGVIVTVGSDSLPGGRATTTGPGGEYLFPALPPGTYDVEFSKTGLQTVIRRAELQVADVSRMDAEIARSDVEETVSSTALLPPLLETAQLSTNIDSASADRLPLGRSIRERLLLAPGLPLPRLSLIDSLVLDETVGDAIAETNVITGALSAQYGSDSGGLVTTATRNGASEATGSLRATFQHDDRDIVEGTLGGAAIEDRLWLLGAADNDATLARATALLSDDQTLIAAHHEDFSLRYETMIGSFGGVEALAAEEQWALRAHSFRSTRGAGSHHIIAGAEDLSDQHDVAFFVNDDWRPSLHWTATGGIRYEERWQPRAGAVYDVRGDGEHRIGASWARYTSADEATLTYGWRFGVGGYARADLIRRAGSLDADLLQLHGTYDIFRLFRVGGNYTTQIRGHLDLQRRANGWLWFEPEVGDGVATLAILQRYLASESASAFSTDLSAMYSYPVRQITTFVKIDLINAFNGEVLTADELSVARTWRGSLGFRF